jgi:hypothetical protein
MEQDPKALIAEAELESARKLIVLASKLHKLRTITLTSLVARGKFTGDHATGSEGQTLRGVVVDALAWNDFNEALIAHLRSNGELAKLCK